MMKKLLLLFSLLALLFSCATGMDIDAKNDDGSPVWITEVPFSTKLYYGVGSAKLSGLHNSQEAADAKARADLARKLEFTIRDATSIYANDTEGLVLNAYEAITVQTVQLTMRGVNLEQRWIADDGTVWSLVSFCVKDIDDTFELEANNYKNKLLEKMLTVQAEHDKQMLEIQKAELIIKNFLLNEKAENSPEVDLAREFLKGLMVQYGADSQGKLHEALLEETNIELDNLHSAIDSIDGECMAKLISDSLLAEGYLQD